MKETFKNLEGIENPNLNRKHRLNLSLCSKDQVVVKRLRRSQKNGVESKD